MCHKQRRIEGPITIAPRLLSTQPTRPGSMINVSGTLGGGTWACQPSSFTEPQGTRRTMAAKQHWRNRKIKKKKTKKNRGNEINFLSLGQTYAKWAKAQNRNSPSPSCNCPPGFSETMARSTVAVRISSPHHRRLVSSANTLPVLHTP